MRVWIDAHLSPAIASWMTSALAVDAVHVRELGLRDARDPDIFEAARTIGAIVMTKDQDFVELVERRGAPPQVVWLTCGNTSNTRLKEILLIAWPRASALLGAGEPVVEITDAID